MIYPSNFLCRYLSNIECCTRNNSDNDCQMLLKKNWQKWKYSGGLKREFELYVKIIEFGLYVLIDARYPRQGS